MVKKLKIGFGPMHRIFPNCGKIIESDSYTEHLKRCPIRSEAEGN
jgi:hypothetical protein